jgi:hypothetical protein
MAPTGMYPLSGYSWELRVPEGVQIVDGPDNVRKAVREQVKYGADWIKFYADRRYYLGDDGKLHSWVNFTDEEMKALVDESHRLGRKVAAHASTGMESTALRAEVNVSSGDGLTAELVDRMVKRRSTGVRRSSSVYVAEGRGGIWPKMVELERPPSAWPPSRPAPVHLYGTDPAAVPGTESGPELDYVVRWDDSDAGDKVGRGGRGC